MWTSISMVSPSENSGDFLFFFEWVIFFVSGKVPALGAVTPCVRIIFIYDYLPLSSLAVMNGL